MLNVERELATVQGQLDAAASELAVMRQQVDMSKLTINYNVPLAAQNDPLAPLAAAGQGFVAITAGSLALMISTFAALLPWAVLVAVGLWAWLAVWRWRWRRAAPKPQAEAPPAT